MEEMINKEFEDYQKDLEIRSLKLKDAVMFVPSDKLDDAMKELKDKKIDL